MSSPPRPSTRSRRRALRRMAGMAGVCAWPGELVPDPASAVRSREPGDYLNVVTRYVETLLGEGRDHYGTQHSPLVAAALDRDTYWLPEGQVLDRLRELPRSEWGIRSHDRVLTGANPMHDQNLYQILYALADATRTDRYRRQADRILQYFFRNCQHPVTGLMPWGEHSGWDFRTEAIIDREAGYTHEFFRPWVLWDRSFRLAPRACRRFAQGLWNHQIGDQETGNFSRHARIDRHDPGLDSEYPRHGGFYIATWAMAYQMAGRDVFRKATDTLLSYFDGRRSETSGAIPAESAERSEGNLVWPHSNLGLAVDLHRHADRMSGDLPGRMRASAERTDEVYLRLDHRLGPDGWGFVTACHTHTLEPGDVRGEDRAFTTDRWATGYGDATDARVALICHLRYRQTEKEGYRALVLRAADRYLEDRPDPEIPLYPGTLGHVILLELAAEELTGEEQYLERARELADWGIATFWPNQSSLPRASSHHDHYEAITRADTLAMALLKLWERETDPVADLRLRFNDR